MTLRLQKVCYVLDLYKSECRLFGPDGRFLQNFGSMDLILFFADSSHNIKHKLYVVDVDQPVLGRDVLRKLGVVIDLSTNLISFPKTKQSFYQPIPLLVSLQYDQMTCQDILNLYPHVISGKCFHEKLTLPFEHSFGVTGPSFSHAAQKMSPRKQRELDRQLDDMLRQGIIEYSQSPYTSRVNLVPKNGKRLFLLFCRLSKT